MKIYLSRLLALVLAVVVGLVGCSSSSGLTGNYRQDTLALISSLRTAINLPKDAPEKAKTQAEARKLINDFAGYYRRDKSLGTLLSFTTMRTILNTIAASYTNAPNRPLPQKVKDRLEVELKQVESALERGS